MSCKLTVSIPAYNDEQSLKIVLSEFDQLKNDWREFDFKVLIIDDGSRDKTLQVAKDYALGKDYVHVVSHPKNLGFGPTFKEAFTLPDTEWIFFLPADNQFPVSNFKKMQPLMYSHDLILGKRTIRKDNLWRRSISSIYNRIISFVLKQRIHDVNSTVLFKNKINLEVDLQSSSAFVNAEFVLKAVKKKYKITETDIQHKERLYGLGSGGKLSVIFPVIRDVFKYIITKR